ncbi:Repeat domain-containing protein [Belliella buryatensis]|uniref:Repeat domain-containing protein n=1 Tax=Belliella buryatensis TaxID=1500549 RepID=A0A239B669_9BACT|nr:VCBS repeat-containing protein [Belliella buryatensis]SNS02748.1 Repeat domain-containing protein [Belliella buryatensis]
MRIKLRVILPLLFVLSCGQKKVQEHFDGVFRKVPSSHSGIDFKNTLVESEDFDVFRYRNFYNGGGVAIGDINNDGLPDIYLTSNTGANKLYLNKGGFEFEDITDSAGVAGSKPWSTGVSMADLNGDGLLDIYVCNSGDVNGRNMENELFINNGDGTFTEMASQFGLDDPGYSTHAVFFDYDSDGDLDMYLLNNSFRPISTLGFRNLRNQRDEKGGDKLYRNDGGIFMDVSEQAGIYGSVIGFGLGISVGDINNSGYPDIFISNDFYERDYLYLNQGDGTFKEVLEDYMNHISMFSMGADIADLNNDGFPEIFTTDMLPESNQRLKRMASFESYDVHQLRLNTGYFYQYMRNTLQLNNGGNSFSEIGYLAGVAATDWSWGALIADFNNSGNKEIFVSNGIYNDLTDQDFVEYLSSNENLKAAIEGEKIDFNAFIAKMTSERISNYLFERSSNLQYKNSAVSWGLSEPSFSNGAAYGDLDGDGDLDLVVNNLNQEAFIYENRSEEFFPEHNFLKVNFKGEDLNVFGLGAKVFVYVDNQVLSFEHLPIRGFQSSMDYDMVIGLGKNERIDSLIVKWPNQKAEKIKEVKLNATLELRQIDANLAWEFKQRGERWLSESSVEIAYHHKENEYSDFDKERLVYEMLSTEGPAFAKADLTANGLEDLYIGGAKNQAGKLFFQFEKGKFKEVLVEAFVNDQASEDVDAEFVDVDGDGVKDLVVISGGSEFVGNAVELKDRVYLNKNGSFIKKEDALPVSFEIGSKVIAYDFNGDGFEDLLIFNRKNKSGYGLIPKHQVLLNDHRGKFSDQTSALFEKSSQLGMVTDAAIFDNKGKTYLVIVGDWMPITFFEIRDGKMLESDLKISGISKTNGWWRKIMVEDLNNDGKVDLIIGNRGLNSRFNASAAHPVKLYVGDFDNNGSTEQVYTFQKDGLDIPYSTRHELVKQLPFLKKKFNTYSSYSNASITDLFDREVLDNSLVLESYVGETMILINQGEGFEKIDIPIEAQLSFTKAIEVIDLNGDGLLDVILGGNFDAVKPELGRYDASYGTILLQDQNGNFNFIPNTIAGYSVRGQIRHLVHLDRSNLLLSIRNNDKIVIHDVNKK